MSTAAHANSQATSDALLQELSDSQPDLLARIARVQPMIPKAYRWVAEMQEIAGFVGGEERQIYEGVSKIYERVERSLEGDGADVDVLKEFVAAARRKM